MPADKEEKELLPGASAFPVSRVHKIMKLDRDVSLASKEAIFLISKTTVRDPSAAGASSCELILKSLN